MKFRALTLMTIFAAALHVSAFAVETELGGVFSGFVKKDGSPYIVKETLIIPEGKSILVEPGVIIKFAAGAGLDIQGGSMAVVGDLNKPVIFTSENESSVWNGISITGVRKSEAQNLLVLNAEFGFAVESGSLELRDVLIDNPQQAGVYVRNGSVDMQWCRVRNSPNIGVWASQGTEVKLDGSHFENNRIALVTSDGSAVTLQRSMLLNNKIGILDFGENRLKQSNSLIQGNKVGFMSKDLPAADIKRALNRNDVAVAQNMDDVADNLGEEPRNPHANGLKRYNMFTDVSEVEPWKISGNLALDLGYHKVLMRHNSSGADYVGGRDTVKIGDTYKNYFQVPGLFANWSASMMMESPSGQTIEFNADISNDSWDYFKVYTLQAIYSDEMNSLTLGDFSVNAGETYLASLNGFGALYRLNLFKNAAGEPLFVGTAFAGEEQAPKAVGSRNYDVYNEYIQDGEAEAQNVVVGGSIRWNMHRRFNGTLGFIGSKDYLEDPFLRDGQLPDVNTLDPLITSRNFFADGNWLFFPGDVKLNGQVAIGAADTANAAKIRAINQVFLGAGLDASNFGLLNKLMKNPQEINSLTREQLESIFGESSLLTPSEMREELRRLLSKASDVAKSTVVSDVTPTSGELWDYNHMAVAGSYEWSNERTFIEGFCRYVGKEYYSAGSADLQQNSRMIGGNFRQKVFDFWRFSFGYTMNVENAADDSTGYNIFGMGEGTKWGMFSGAETDWLKEHEQGENRTLYIHDAYVGNQFKLNKTIDLSLRYAVNYRTRSTAQRLYANYNVNSGIYNDGWFRPRAGHSTVDVISGADTLRIDSAHWAQYYNLSKYEYLATQFEEKILRHHIMLDFTFKLPMNVLKVGSAFMIRKDYSEFVQDKLLNGLDFSDETFGILGYHFHGSEFFEQRYPITLTTSLNGFKNVFSVTPRYKIFNRNDMTEFEWTVNENMTFPIADEFLELTLNGGVRQNFLDYEVRKQKYSEMELDVDASVALRINHTDKLYSVWTIGSVLNYRPDNLADEYKDLYGIASVNYAF